MVFEHPSRKVSRKAGAGGVSCGLKDSIFSNVMGVIIAWKRPDVKEPANPTNPAHEKI